MMKMAKIPFQKLRIINWFRNHKSTMLECAKGTGIERANICYILFGLREEGLIECVGTRRDFYTGEKAMVFKLKEGGEI